MCDLDLNGYIKKNSKFTGSIIKNIENREFKVLGYFVNNKLNSKKFVIEFLETGYITLTSHSILKSGRVLDRLYPSNNNGGCLGYASMKDNKRAYHMWKHMLNRCYNEMDKNYYRYGKLGVKVCDEWFRFDNFLMSLKYIDGFDYLKFEKSEIDLDKDFKQINKPYSEIIYSPETCTFLSKIENSKIVRHQGKGKSILLTDLNNGNTYKFNSILKCSKFCKIDRHTVSNYINSNYLNWKFERL